MPQKVGKKMGIRFYENVFSEINLLLLKTRLAGQGSENC